MYTDELGYDLMKDTEYFVLLLTSVTTADEYDVLVNSDKSIGTTEYLTLQARCCVN
jgi:hypothetical protein